MGVEVETRKAIVLAELPAAPGVTASCAAAYGQEETNISIEHFITYFTHCSQLGL